VRRRLDYRTGRLVGAEVFSRQVVTPNKTCSPYPWSRAVRILCE